MEASEVAGHHHAEQQRLVSGSRDVGYGTQVEITHPPNQKVADDEVEEAPQDVDG